MSAWSAAAKFATGLVARGRLLPAVSDGGFDAWTAGPLDPGHHRYLDALVDAVPEDLRLNFERVRKLFLYGLLEYDFFSAA